MNSLPWYRRTLRWAQTNLVEIDPARYDGAFWRDQWRRTRVQGVIVNAGGIIAYYPSAFPLHYRAHTLGERDLFGEIVAAAREEGLTVVARMDSNRVAADFEAAHPDWIARDLNGKPFMVGERFVTCINSPYYTDYLPEVMREIITRYRPDGFSDNSWPGMPRERICHCRHCAERFRAASGMALPERQDFTSPAYRAWIRWNYRLRTALWEANNAVTRAAGGPDCHWSGMISGDILNNGNRFIDLREILQRTDIVMLDHQRRNGVDGFEQNTEAGLRLHETGGWDKLIPESTPQYQLGHPAFRLSSMPAPEVRLWASAAFAGGIQPWWHHIGACHDDRRQYATAEPIFRWHEDNARYLHDRLPVADVAVVWSQANHDFFGRDNAEERSLNPYRGIVRALDRAGLSWLPVHAADLSGVAGRFPVMVLPNLAVMGEAEAAAIEAFVAAGGSVLATGESGRYDEVGEKRPHGLLDDLFGLRFTEGSVGGMGKAHHSIEISDRHSYLRLDPELRGRVRGPVDPAAPVPRGLRHPLLAGLDATDSMPFGGFLPLAEAGQGSAVLATYVPDFPIFPPETSWMREPRTAIPAIIARTHATGGRLAWLIADLDRCFARDENPDHALVLSNAVEWMLAGRRSLWLSGGHGLISANLYRQGERLVLHLNNRLLLSRVPGRQYDLVPVGPVHVGLRNAAPASTVALRVAGTNIPAMRDGEWLNFTVPQVLDHELVVAEA